MNTITISVDGLDEGIRCALCTNHIRTDRGCDGNCSYNKNLFESIMGVIKNSIVNNAPTVERPTAKWIHRRIIAENRSFDMIVCSNCQTEFSWDAETGVSMDNYNTCPNCTAGMRSD